MKASFAHRCVHVLDRDKEIEFYQKALGMKVVRVKGPADGSWINTFMANDASPVEIELTWNRVPPETPYENGGKDTHIGFVVDDYDAFHKLHEEMGCIARENHALGIYFITDPEGNWIEILPENR